MVEECSAVVGEGGVVVAEIFTVVGGECFAADREVVVVVGECFAADRDVVVVVVVVAAASAGRAIRRKWSMKRLVVSWSSGASKAVKSRRILATSFDLAKGGPAKGRPPGENVNVKTVSV